MCGFFDNGDVDEFVEEVGLNAAADIFRKYKCELSSEPNQARQQLAVFLKDVLKNG